MLLTSLAMLTWYSEELLLFRFNCVTFPLKVCVRIVQSWVWTAQAGMCRICGAFLDVYGPGCDVLCLWGSSCMCAVQADLRIIHCLAICQCDTECFVLSL